MQVQHRVLKKARCVRCRRWLGTMADPKAAFFMVYPRRSRKAFEALVEDWCGILVSDNCGVYRHWVDPRQQWRAHLIRKAAGLCDRTDARLSRFGAQLYRLLQQLVGFAHAPPKKRKWKRTAAEPGVAGVIVTRSPL